MFHKHTTRTCIISALIAGLAGASAAQAEMSISEQMGMVDRVVTWSAGSPDMLDSVTLESIPAGGKSLEFVSIPPCRIFDTRKSGGPFGGGVFREYSVLNANVPGQGGNASGCNIPSDAASVVMNLTTVAGSPANDGYTKAGPGGSTPVATILAYLQGQGVSVGTTVPLSLTSKMRIQNFGGSTNMAADVQGYYRQTLHASVTSAGTLFEGRGSGVVLIETSADSLATGQYVVTFNRDISECTFVVSRWYTDNTLVDAVRNGPVGEVYVNVTDTSGTWVDGSGFNLVVSC